MKDKSMTLRSVLTGFALLASLILAAPSQAGDIYRDAALISSMPIGGVTLSMTRAEAEAHLQATGFTETDRSTPQNGSGAVTFRKGIVHIALGYRGEQLESIGENSQRLDGSRFDLAAEIAPPRAHFGIADGERDCRSNKRGAVCSVADKRQATVGYALQVRPTLKTAQLVRYPPR
jgi:hypothetical protein